MSDITKTHSAKYGYFYALAGPLALITVVALMGMNEPDEQRAFFMIRWWALFAVLLTILAGIFRLAAHGDQEKKDMDGWGKAIGLSAAIIALPAALVAFFGLTA